MAQEIERKFLVLDDSFKHEAFSKSHIVQGYICSERGRTVRVRIRDERAYLTIKGPSENGGLSRYEFEREIPLEDGQQMMQLCEPGIIDKTRWLVKSGKHTLAYEDEPYEKPHFIGKEVTGDRRYYNSCLCVKPFNKW